MYLEHRITRIEDRGRSETVELKQPRCCHRCHCVMHVIIIDGSYFVFHRAHSISSWWRRANPDSESPGPWSDPDCIAKFCETFASKVAELPKRIGARGPSMTVVARDCPRSEIWRNDSHDSYKAGRVRDATPMGVLFTEAYDRLFAAGGASTVLEWPGLEADDCAALASRALCALDNVSRISIISNDQDYAQLLGGKIEVRMLGGTRGELPALTSSANCSGDAPRDLFVKIVCGDKSDNISGVFPRCGPKTALKLYSDPALLERQFSKHPGSRERFAHNRRLIDFNEIPATLKSAFEEGCLWPALVHLLTPGPETE